MNTKPLCHFIIALSVLIFVNGAENETEIPNELFDHDPETDNNKHNALLFHLSINQSEEGLSKILIKIDINNDSIITHEELAHWILKSNDAIEEKEAGEYINQYDHDNDSRVSWEEYLEHFYGSPTLDFAKSSSDHKEIFEFVETDKFRFQSADVNKDGLLTVAELKAFLHPHSHLEMLHYEGLKLIKDYDMNNDSMISKEELGHIQYGGVTMNPLQKTRINRVFEKYDLDKDDKLSIDETKMWLKPDVTEYARTEASHLIKVSDVNKDGKVTKDEILESLEHWMTSKATNFGDHVRDEL